MDWEIRGRRLGGIGGAFACAAKPSECASRGDRRTCAEIEGTLAEMGSAKTVGQVAGGHGGRGVPVGEQREPDLAAPWVGATARAAPRASAGDTAAGLCREQ